MAIGAIATCCSGLLRSLDRMKLVVTSYVTLDGAATGSLKLKWADDRPGTAAPATGKVDGTTVNGAFPAP